MKRVVQLGSGLVAPPLVKALLEAGDVRLTLADAAPGKAEALIRGHPRGEAAVADLSKAEEVERLVEGAEVVVSLLPAPMHPAVAAACLAHGKHLVTASYVSPAMRALDAEARAQGLLFLNEIGLDPGLDHMSAMRVIHRVRKEGGRVTSFRSYCGGLPAPEANTNPLGYKFSWSPRGVLTAARNAAKYLEDGKVVEVPGPELFSRFHLLEVEGAGTFEAYPNRDSTSYQGVYGLEDAKTVYRGTLRNLGHCDTWFRWARLGLFDLSERADLAGRTHAEVLRELAGGGRKALPAALAAKMGCAPGDPAVAKLEWLGVLSRKKVGPGVTTVLDLLAARMLEKMQYAPGERDMVVLVHKFVAEFPGGRREEITSSLVDFGIPGGDSSMARTVALPVALAVRLILDGKLAVRGVRIPVIPEIYEPVLDGLERLGIVCKESRRGL